MGIADHAKRSRSLRTRSLDTVLDQRSSDSTSPDVGIDEQSVQFGISIRTREQCSKSDDSAVSFRHEHRTGGDLIYWQFNRIWMGEQGVAISGIGKRRPKLQSLNLFLFRDDRATNKETIHSPAVYILFT